MGDQHEAAIVVGAANLVAAQLPGVAWEDYEKILCNTEQGEERIGLLWD